MRAIDAKAHAYALVGLATAAEFKFRRRDATEALRGEVDAQIIFELVVFALAGAWLVLSSIQQDDRLEAYMPWRFGPALATYGLICVLALVTSAYAPSILSVVRAIQFCLVAAFVLSAARLLRDDDDALVEFWRALRRAIWWVIAIGTVGTLVLEGAALPEIDGAGRYRWFQLHPISTANIMGIGLVLTAGSWFGIPDAWQRHRSKWTVAGPALGVLAVLLLLTKSRGALAATLGALTVLAMMSTNRTRRGIAALLVLTAVAAILLGAGIETLEAIITRNRSTTELLTLTGRTELLGIAYDLFLQRPLTGYGFLAARSVFLEAVPWAPGHAHNLFAEVAISFGIPGLLAYGVLIGSVAAASLRALLDPVPSVRRLVMAEAAALLVFVLLAGVVGGGAAYLPGFELLALVIAGLAADLWRRRGATAAVRPARARPARR